MINETTVDYQFSTPLDGNIAITSRYHENQVLQKNNTLYKFLWVRKGNISVEVDHVKMRLNKDEIMPLTPLHHFDIDTVNGEYLTVLFNSNFYCIFGNDDEVSCSGFLFHGSSNVMVLKLTADESATLCSTIDEFIAETEIRDRHQEEMLRILLKRFIIISTRIARKRYSMNKDCEKAFDIVRKFHVLVDNNYKEKKRVQDYADMLFRSPKTLSNLFATYDLPSPLHIIHERVEAEAKRLLIYTDKSAKEISDILGFEDIATFSRFFKKMTGKSISDFRKEKE
jgi:AraC family transcriptional regulator, transcriptional activator of pobA